MNKIAFIGVGIMGRSMVRNLMKAGFELHIYARTRSKVEDVISEGATFHDTIADCVKDAEAVITIVGFPTDVEEVYFDAGNILDSAKEGAYLIDMTTTSPMLDQKIAEEGYTLHPGRRFQRRLRSLHAVIRGDGKQHQLSGRIRLRPARQTCEPDHDRRHLIRSLRGTHLCEGKRP